jgi:hypothetical protein
MSIPWMERGLGQGEEASTSCRLLREGVSVLK